MTPWSFAYQGPLVVAVAWSGSVTGAVAVTYDPSLRVTRQNVNGADPVNYSYDHDGLLTQAGDLTLTNDPLTGLLTGTKIHGVANHWDFNEFAELTNYSAILSNQVLFSSQYSRDALGRITRKTETIQGSLPDLRLCL